MAYTWTKLATVRLAADGTSLDTGDDPALTGNVFADKKYLHIEMTYSGINGGATDAVLRIGRGTTSSSGYYQRVSNNQASDVATEPSSFYNAFCWAGYTGVDTWHYSSFNITNFSGTDKLAEGWCMRTGSTGSGSSLPSMVEAIGSWNGTDQINRIELTGSGGDGKYASGSTITVWGADDDAIVDEKSLITNVPLGTRYEETDTRNIYRYANDLVSGTDLKCYIKFDDASGNHTNKAGSVAGNATLGSAADIVPAGTGTIDYQVTGLPSKLGTGAEYPSTSATSGKYGVFGSGANTSQFNFLHGGGTSTKFTVTFWAKYDTTAYNNQVIIRSGTGDTTAGLVIYHYGPSSGDGGIRCFISTLNGGNQQPMEGYSTGGFFLFDDAWHFYTFQLDWQESTDKLIMTRDMGTSTPARQTFNQNGSYVPDAITQNAADPLCFRQDADARGTYIPPTAEYAEMSLWSRCLTHAEITKIYNSGNGMQLDTGVDVWKEKGTA